MPPPCATAVFRPRSTATNDPGARHRRRPARAGPAMARAGRPHRLRADHGQPARRPFRPGAAGAPAWRHGGGQHLRQPDPVRPHRGLRALSAHARPRHRRPARGRLRPGLPADGGGDVSLRHHRLRADARAGHHRHPLRRAPAGSLQRRCHRGRAPVQHGAAGPGGVRAQGLPAAAGDPLHGARAGFPGRHRAGADPARGRRPGHELAQPVPRAGAAPDRGAHLPDPVLHARRVPPGPAAGGHRGRGARTAGGGRLRGGLRRDPPRRPVAATRVRRTRPAGADRRPPGAHPPDRQPGVRHALMLSDRHWREILGHAERLRRHPLRELTAVEGRAQAMSLSVGPIHASFARQHLDAQAWSSLLAMAGEAGLDTALRALFEGEPVNASESRPALHMALRDGAGGRPVAAAASAEARRARERMQALAAALADSPVTDIVHVGIGGSDLGPLLAVDALRDFTAGRFRVHFLSNADGGVAARLLAGLDPAKTAGVLVSKSFGTRETLLNGEALRDWMGGSERLYAVSANIEKARAFGIGEERVLPMWDWVGGRYSLWSAVGFSILLALGGDNFGRLLAGAAMMDAHVRDTALAENLAVWHALTAIW